MARVGGYVAIGTDPRAGLHAERHSVCDLACRAILIDA